MGQLTMAELTRNTWKGQETREVTEQKQNTMGEQSQVNQQGKSQQGWG